MLNRDIYVKSPEQNRLANNGVAEVSEDHSDAALEVLRYELESFVCDGQYAKGTETILETFLRNLGAKSEQPGVWISGFYGSGKSHLAKMLRALWIDQQLPGGASARGLADLPDGVADQFKELSTEGKRNGGLHAAAGKLGAGAGDNVRLALLGIIFKSKGLPEQFAQARFVMWLKHEGLLEAVQSNLKAAGRSLAQELPHLYVSNHLSNALLQANRGLADSEAAVRQLIKAQFPQVGDVTNDEMVAAIQSALAEGGKFPLTLVVLDEVQQYIGSDAEKAYKVQEVTESLSKHFNGQLLFVGTGQSALSGMPNLQRLMGRFPVQVTLGDWDVENVTRKIILAKKSTAVPEVDRVWRDNLGEISRHLRGTKLEHVTDDEAFITADYPILPVRRRFWENVLRTIDATGTVAQLRSQLRVVHEAALETAELPLGHVVSGDFLYDQIAANLVSTAQLSREIFDSVQRFAAGDGPSQLKARLLKLIYLINKLPPEKAIAIGLKPTEDVLADLLVTDLKSGSSELRKTIPTLLDALQEKDHLVMALDGPNGAEYHLQTRESSAWYEEFRAQESQLKASPQNIEVKRADFFKARFRSVLTKVRAVQGLAPEVRTLTACFDESLPKDNDKALYLWIQDGWQTDEKSVIAEARAKSAENPTLFAFMPAQSKTDLANAIVTLEAAKATLSRKGTPNTEEGRNAQRSMESRQRNAEKEIETLLNTLFAGVRVFQAGGQEVTQGNDLADRLNTAVKSSVIRLYREFDVADQKGWDKVLDEARKGNAEAMRAIGHLQEPKSHAVCQKVLSFLGGGKKGAEIRDNFESPPYGWPRDTIDGALYILLTTGELKARDMAHRPVDAKSLERSKLTQAFFEPESVNISPVQKIRIRGLFQSLGVGCQPNEELLKAPILIAKLKELALCAGGPAPQPEPPRSDAIVALEQALGNGLLLELFSRAEALIALAKQWEQTAKLIKQRLPLWHQLDALLEHARALGPYVELKAEVGAITAQRSLLAEPDPVRPLLERTTDLLRQALNAKLDAYRAEYEQQMAQLDADSNWQKLDDAQRSELIRTHHIDAPARLDISTADKLADALDDCDLQRWIERTQALTTRFGAVRMDAAKLLKPNVVQVKLPQRTLNDAGEVKAWLMEVERLLLKAIEKGPVAL
ncbi:BREX system P-loop protein BrxC [Thauera phenolivorans]|uniref:BREX system P-loop protein BrxC n=1 Tax=Thauera phenolivorans TaxID=1792543 RepID=UPI00083B12F8|nr:BREX system P-loop protein BrxC [Thauera phenolivorans]